MTFWERLLLDVLWADKKYLVVLVCGGRDYDDELVFDHLMDYLLAGFKKRYPNDDMVIVHGGARGADTLADLWAKSRKVPVIAVPADWETHGKAAGVIRNAEMLKKWKPQIVIAFPGGRGTAHMVSIARKAGVHVHEVKV